MHILNMIYIALKRQNMSFGTPKNPPRAASRFQRSPVILQMLHIIYPPPPPQLRPWVRLYVLSLLRTGSNRLIPTDGGGGGYGFHGRGYGVYDRCEEKYGEHTMLVINQSYCRIDASCGIIVIPNHFKMFLWFVI